MSELSEAVSAAKQTDSEALELARLGWKAQRKLKAREAADAAAQAEADRRGRRVYWRTWDVTVPPEYADSNGDRTVTVKLPTVAVAEPADGRYSDRGILALAQQAARIAADQAAKARKDRTPVRLTAGERECLAQELAVTLLSADPAGLPKRGSLSGERSENPADWPSADLAWLTGEARNLILRGSERGDRASWRDCYGDTSWGSATGDGSATLAEAIGAADCLSGSLADAERDPYLSDASGTDPLSHADQAAVRLTGTGREARRALACGLAGEATSADWLAADGKAADRGARREWRRSRDRGAARIRRDLAAGKLSGEAVAQTVPPRRTGAGDLAAADPIGASAAQRAYRRTLQADAPDARWLARRRRLTAATGRDPQVGRDQAATRRWLTAARTRGETESEAQARRAIPIARGDLASD